MHPSSKLTPAILQPASSRRETDRERRHISGEFCFVSEFVGGRCGWMTLRRMLVLICISGGVFLHAEETATVVIPPEPEMPTIEGMTPQQRQEARIKWRADSRAWEAGLTVEQKAEIKRRADEKTRRNNEEMERRQRLPIPADGYTWQEAAAQRKLDAQTVERLGRDKIAYGRSVKQSFDPYFSGPIFITSDSLLNGFHVLFEDTFRDHEVRQIDELRAKLETVFQQARKNLGATSVAASDLAPAWRQAQFVLGPALCILGTPADLFDADVREEIQNQVARIRAAQSVELPSWLAPATRKMPALDYRACKPVGFYTQSPVLADYFRAVRWLQLVPFRMDREVELTAMGMLGYGLNQAYQVHAESYFRAYAAVLGSTNQRALLEAAREFQNFLVAGGNETWPEILREKKRWLLRDVAPRDEKTGGLMLPANADALLSAIEFRVLPAYLLPDTKLFQRLADMNLEPEGLAVAAMLGSGFARDRLTHFTPAQFEAAVTEVRPGDVERKPLAVPSLYEDYLRVLSALFSAPPADGPAFLRGEAWQAKSCQTALGGWAQMRHTFSLQAHRSETYFGMSIVPPGFVEPNPEFYSRMADLIERTRKLLDDNRDRWDELVSVTRKLEALAHKQLRNLPWSPEDVEFLKHYGERMGLIMGYYGNSYEVPNDDAPRWAEVHRNMPADFSLVAAIGRPREIYVLYPWNGMEILCTGSVMPYFEYQSKERLTDTEWKGLLDSSRAPLQPGWLRPFVGK